MPGTSKLSPLSPLSFCIRTIERWRCQPPGTAPENDTAVINNHLPQLYPHPGKLGGFKGLFVPVLETPRSGRAPSPCRSGLAES